MNTPIIVGNTKAYLKNIRQIKEIQEKIWQNLAKENYKYYYCVPNIFLKELIEEKYWAPIFGSQKVDTAKDGANTGAITPEMLKSIGAKIVIIGHSEQREYENEEIINQKLEACLKEKIISVLCIGEREKKQNEEYLNIITSQIKSALKNINKNNLDKLIIAYEPVWAIGRTSSATARETLECVVHIRKILVEIFGIQDAKKIKIIYGGSVTSENIKNFVIESSVDGVLVGRASTNPLEFSKIINSLYAK